MTLEVITPAEVEPLEVSDLYDHLSLFTDGSPPASAYDEWIETAISAAREHCEAITRRTIIKTVFKYTVDRFPAFAEPIMLPVSPLISVDSIEYTDEAGATQSFTDFDTSNEQQRPELFPSHGVNWPSVRRQRNGVRITLTAGYRPSGSPEDLRANVPARFEQAIKYLVAGMDMQREHVVVGSIIAEDKTLMSLLWPLRLYEV